MILEYAMTYAYVRVKIHLFVGGGILAGAVGMSILINN